MAATFAVIFVAFYAAHMVADHWIQTQWQADHKGQPGWTGRLACAGHVLTYTYTTVVTVGVARWRLDLDLSYRNVCVGLAISAITHYIADRRTPLRRLADACRKDPTWLVHGGGMYALDQSWHIGWLFVSTLVVVA